MPPLLNYRAMKRPIAAPGALLRRLGTVDAALIVMGGIVGSGIFMNPSVVARYLHSAPLIMLAWVVGGFIALIGAGLFAELGARRPSDGGLYAYVRDAFHPVVAFMYGWTLLLVSQSGGMAASAVTFGTYFTPLTGLHVEPKLLAAGVIAVFTIVNCLGVREGTTTQNAFMFAKIAAIAGLIIVGLFAPHAAAGAATPVPLAGGGNILVALGLALVPVMFAYSGYQTSSFMSAEMREPQRTLPRGMLLGVLAVIALYLGVNAICLLGLGAHGLAATSTPASAIAQLAFGVPGARIMAVVVAISTLGFIVNQILTAPRVYFQMAADGVFFKSLAWIHPRTHVPVIAIAAQGVVGIIIAFSGAYDAILNYVTSVDYVFFTLCAIALFIFRARDARRGDATKPGFTLPLHPWSTAIFMLFSGSIVLDVLIKAPRDTGIGLAILLSGIPIYFWFARTRGPEGRHVEEPA